MRRALCALAVTVGLWGWGCPSNKGAPAPAEAPAPSAAPDAGASLGPWGYVITPRALDGYIAYQRRTLALYARLLKELPALERRDGGEDARAVALLQKHASEQERIRRELGLGAVDVQELERIVGDVISRRAATLPAEQLDSLERMAALAEHLPEDSRKEFEQTVAALKARAAAQDPLTEERKKYGDANVELVLSREKELTGLWNQAISVFAGASPVRRAEDAGER